MNYPRVYVLLARQGRTGLVVRQGKVTATLSWDRDRDKFRLGQWVRGRIDQYFCDLSEDGKYFVYSLHST